MLFMLFMLFVQYARSTLVPPKDTHCFVSPPPCQDSAAAAQAAPSIMQRLSRRTYGTLVRIWPRGSAAAQASGDGSPCVYVTGFMTDTKQESNWESWLPAHRQLAASPLPWAEAAYGYHWQTGAAGDWFGRWPLPVHAAALLARRSSPATLLAAVTADALVNATRLLLHFRAAEAAAVTDAPGLARACADFDGRYRLLAHSLGCRLVLEALPLLPAEQRPQEVHLMAAAATEEAHARRLPQLVSPEGGRVYHYYCGADEALASGFLLASGGRRALGSGPLPEEARDSSVTSVDATPYFLDEEDRHLFHGAYKEHLPQLVSDARAGRPRPPAPPQEWRRRQQARVHATLRRALARIPVPTLRLPAAPRAAASGAVGAVRSWVTSRARGKP